MKQEPERAAMMEAGFVVALLLALSGTSFVALLE